jgi:hypothetical protein
MKIIMLKNDTRQNDTCRKDTWHNNKKCDTQDR